MAESGGKSSQLIVDLNNKEPKLVKDSKRPLYGRVELNLEQCILPEGKLNDTPSVKDGLSKEEELDLRILGCELIQNSGILLRLPQVAMATAQVLYQRFYYSESFVRQPMAIVAMASVALASKVEEAPRRIRDVINVFNHMKQVRNNMPIKAIILNEDYVKLKNNVIKAERRILKNLGFCIHVKHPHKFVVTLIQNVLGIGNHELVQLSWNYMNDCLRTEAFVRYSPETIACSCVYLGARVLRIPLPSKPGWYEIFRISEKEMKEVGRLILSLYSRAKPDQLKLEKVVDTLKRKIDESKSSRSRH
ncbi:Cyclin-L2 [Halotydeus destructor]|nr:Cyclin-L2 [Halotydeus destructor]